MGATAKGNHGHQGTMPGQWRDGGGIVAGGRRDKERDHTGTMPARCGYEGPHRIPLAIVGMLIAGTY